MNTKTEIGTAGVGQVETLAVVTMTNEEFIKLYKKNVIPLYVVLPCLVWVLHDYFVTIEDEVNYVWRKKLNLGRGLYLWIRYYTILLLVFDAAQIHSFAIPGVATKSVCLAMDPTIRVVGAVSLWSIQIIMQLRIYALFDKSRKLALFNALFFFLSIVGFLVILIINAIRRPALIAKAFGLPLPGCPVVNGLVQWAQWIPATIFELNMFIQALYKSYTSLSKHVKLQKRVSLQEILLGDHILYFFGISVLLIFNNMMVITGITRIPWFGLAPFHASMGILTCRMLLNLFEFTSNNLEGGLKSCGQIRTDVWRGMGLEDLDEGGAIAVRKGESAEEGGTKGWKDGTANGIWGSSVEGGREEIGDSVGVVAGMKGKGKMRDYDSWSGVESGVDSTHSRRSSVTLSLTLTTTHSRSSSSSLSSSSVTQSHVVKSSAAAPGDGEARRGSDGTLVEVLADAAGKSNGLEG